MTFSAFGPALGAALALVALGLYALVTKRHIIRILIGLQLLSQGTLLALLAAGQYAGQLAVAQALVITVIVADTIVTTAGLALAVRVWQRLGTLDLADLATLKG